MKFTIFLLAANAFFFIDMVRVGSPLAILNLIAVGVLVTSIINKLEKEE